jgi:phosphoribosylanthranilate isomerase
MINGIQVKVCGLTSLADAEAADAEGADYLGFILYPKSPRYISLDRFKSLSAHLPNREKVAVMVEPSAEELISAREAGFDRVQLHFPNETAFFQVVQWGETIPREMIWLAPRVPPGKELDPAFAPLAETILVDTYSPDVLGGSGQTGDWERFAALRNKFRRVQWILSGGLNPDNIAAAIAATGARVVDVNSGVEAAPGVKDHARLRVFFDALRNLAPPPAAL